MIASLNHGAVPKGLTAGPRRAVPLHGDKADWRMLDLPIPEAPQPLGQYEREQFFAFVESSDELLSRELHAGGHDGKWFAELLKARDAQGLGAPRRVAWLDCVRAEYFSSLAWRGERCEINDPADAARRKARLDTLDASQFRVALLPIGTAGDDEHAFWAAMTQSLWHLVAFGEPGIPVVVAPDFDLALGGVTLTGIRYHRPCHEGERASLYNVFNLNFLPDARRDGLGGTPTDVPPGGLPPAGPEHDAVHVTARVVTGRVAGTSPHGRNAERAQGFDKLQGATRGDKS
jgi:hypothetical protein